MVGRYFWRPTIMIASAYIHRDLRSHFRSDVRHRPFPQRGAEPGRREWPGGGVSGTQGTEDSVPGRLLSRRKVRLPSARVFGIVRHGPVGGNPPAWQSPLFRNRDRRCFAASSQHYAGGNPITTATGVALQSGMGRTYVGSRQIRAHQPSPSASDLMPVPAAGITGANPPATLRYVTNRPTLTDAIRRVPFGSATGADAASLRTAS